MKGIPEERIKDRLDDWREAYKEKDANVQFIDGVIYALDSLVNECKELNQLQPIDGNTPKDRRIILKFGDLKVVGKWRQLNSNIGYFIHDLLRYEPPENPPTHWQELPGDPK